MGSSGGQRVGPFDGAVFGRPRLARQENVTLNNGSTLTMANLAGQGVVREIWLALGFNNTMGDLRLRVTVDGEGSPAIDTDLASLFVTHPDSEDLNGSVSTRFVHAEGASSGGQLGCIFTFPMPFNNGILVELVNNTGALVIAYSQVHYTADTPPPWRLRAAAVPHASPTVLAAGDTFEFLNLGAGAAGWLVYHGICGDSTIAGNGTWIERDIEIQLDGEGSPSWASTGLEDWFGGSFGFQGRSHFGTGFYIAGVQTDDDRAMAVDLAATYAGGIRFTNGVRVVMGTEAGTTTGHSMGWVLLYYLEV